MRKGLNQREKISSYREVVNSRNSDMMVACEKAVQILQNNDWRALTNSSRAVFEVENVAFVDCKVCVLNYNGTIMASLFGRKSPQSLYNDFHIDLSTHPRITEEFLQKQYLKQEEE